MLLSLHGVLPHTMTMSFNDKSLRTVQHLKGNRHEHYQKGMLGEFAQTPSLHNLQWGVLKAGHGLQELRHSGHGTLRSLRTFQGCYLSNFMMLFHELHRLQLEYNHTVNIYK